MFGGKRKLWLHLLAGMVSLGAATTASWAGMDYQYTAGGGEQLYTDAVNADGPWLWQMLPQVFGVTAPTGQSFSFAEPGMGNSVGDARGQVMNMGGFDGTNLKVIYDVLVWVPVPQILFLPVGGNYSSFVNNGVLVGADYGSFFSGGGSAGGGGGGGAVATAAPFFFIIPEPSIGILVSLGGLALLLRRGRQG